MDEWYDRRTPYGPPPGFQNGPGPWTPPGQNLPPANPSNWIPGPYPSNGSVGCWTQSDTPLVWGGPSAMTGSVRSSLWLSPVFDLRPDLKVVGDSRQNVQQIWISHGSGGQLYVHIAGLQNANDTLTDLVVTKREGGHPVSAAGINGVTSSGREDQTSYFSSDQNSVNLVFQPPGSGYPIRYWQVGIQFDVLSAKADPVLTVAAGYY